MKKELIKEIEIPKNVEIHLNKNKLDVKGLEGELSREFKLGKINLEKKENKIILSHKKATKIEKKMMNTIAAHILNMIKGVQEKFEYKLKVCSSHFPMTVKAENNKIIVKNFLGEKIDREKDIPQGTEIKIEKDIITVRSINKELAGQTAANFEAITKIRNRDNRVFQDGIYIINKAGREI